MRIVSGTARGRKIQAPPGRGTRPITDRAKEGIFNMLESLGGVTDAVVVDLFAGSGSFGIECLSRGAERVVFVERDRNALHTLQSNVDMLGFADRAQVIAGSVEAALGGLPEADVAFCDPPYADDPWLELLGALRCDLLIGHAERPVPLTDRWVELRRRSYGKAQIVIAERSDLAAEQSDL
ncbi:MAG: RsmD family RNA methyltransferase [Acidimicrobiales bacterium]